MLDNNSRKNIKYFLTLVIFFIAGVLSVLAYQNFQEKNIQAQTSVNTDYNNDVSDTPTPEWIPYPTATTIPVRYTAPSSKLTIMETQKISADRAMAETGETVNYTVTLKNTGNKKKFLTHICFNHSGGVTFGCLLNMNLESYKEFNINNSMTYKTPGTYSTWVTWSQDGNNFYRPQSGGSAVVKIY